MIGIMSPNAMLDYIDETLSSMEEEMTEDELSISPSYITFKHCYALLKKECKGEIKLG